MIILEDFHYMIHDVLTQKLDPEQREAFTMRLADFDDVTYKLESAMETKDIVTVSIAMPAVESIRQFVDLYLAAQYPGLVVAPEQGFNVTLRLDLNQASEAIINNVAKLKRNILAAPLNNVFQAVAAGQALPPLTIPFRRNENMYIVVNPKKQASSEDTISVVFALSFTDPTDVVIADVFLKEFSTARKDSDMSNSPSVTYSPNKPPLELEGLSVPQGSGIGYLSFVLFKRHYSGSNTENVLTAVSMFRAYLAYHIKCSKGYMHSRMRKSVTEQLQVLRRAVPEPLEAKEKKTASGRTFTRK